MKVWLFVEQPPFGEDPALLGGAQVVADTRQHAVAALNAEFKRRGLHVLATTMDLRPVDTSKESVLIIEDIMFAQTPQRERKLRQTLQEVDGALARLTPFLRLFYAAVVGFLVLWGLAIRQRLDDTTNVTLTGGLVIISVLCIAVAIYEYRLRSRRTALAKRLETSQEAGSDAEKLNSTTPQ